MKSPHLILALVAISIVVALLTGGTRYADRLERRYVRALAPLEFDQKYVGSALQRAAFRQPDLLPIYGSSELSLQKRYQEPYRAVTVFRGEPTGFTIFPVGLGDTTDLIMLQRLAAVGRELRGKRVVISLSPTWFYERAQVPAETYAGNFSRLQAAALVWSIDLSFDLKRDVAQRMLDYPATLDSDPLLRFAVGQLADRSLLSRALYYLTLPLGMLDNLALRLQDHWEMLMYIRSRSLAEQPARSAGPPDWNAVMVQARADSQWQANNNDFGFDKRDWEERLGRVVAARHGSMSDVQFKRDMHLAREWTDLDLLLRTLHELGARPLVLSMPLAGSYLNYVGVSAQTRALYYDHVRRMAARYGAQSCVFADHDQDRLFLLNSRAHLMPEGWVYYDRALDDFYHGRLLSCMA